MLPVAATFVGVAAALAMSGGAARALETDKTLSGPQRGVATLAAQPWKALAAPFEQKIGKFDVGGKFGASGSLLTGDIPSLFKNGLGAFRATSLPNNMIGVHGIGFDCSSPFTLSSSGIQESSQASTFLLQWLLLTVDGVANTAAATAPTELKAEMKKIRDATVSIADLLRWNADTTLVSLALGSADNSR
jgi:hypothetical protein